MYVKTKNSQVVKYPYNLDDLRKDNPKVSFPANISDALLAQLDVFPVENVAPDIDDATQVAMNKGCQYDAESSSWKIKWEVRAKTAEELAAEAAAEEQNVRAQRTRLLADCDWTQLPDAPVDAAAWASYRQALRDITDQPGFPYNVTWPVAP